jgi:D-lyxose ketol-isomerase
MKRSEVNQQMAETLKLCAVHGMRLPPFATWSPEDWKTRGRDCIGIVRQQLGWDITDFGSGDFASTGLVLFSIRNGVFSDVARNPMAKAYAEKLMVVQEMQVTPTHMHYKKTEDIINRGGGILVIQLWNATADHKLDDSDVTVETDGQRRTVGAGETVEIHPGESITLPNGQYHKFWGKKGAGPTLVGEVSRVCDEYSDNHFLDSVGRFSQIEEDQPPDYLLFNDYERYYPYFSEATGHAAS